MQEAVNLAPAPVVHGARNTLMLRIERVLIGNAQRVDARQ
jgi:hypothetical protein